MQSNAPYHVTILQELHANKSSAREIATSTADAPDSAVRIGGYLIVWGNRSQRDLQGEYFTPQTELALDWFERRPVLYQHGMDDHLKASPIGVIDQLHPDDTGVWAEAQIDLRHRYAAAVRRLIEHGLLGWSSGSLPHLVEVARDGRILRWPLVEGSLTPTPAEPRRTDVQTIKSAYDALGLDTERLAIPATDRRPLHLLIASSQVQRSSDSSQKGLRRMPAGNTPFNDPFDLADRQDRALYPTSGRKRLPFPTHGEGDTQPLPALHANHISVGSSYDRLDAVDLLHGYMLLRAAKSFQGVSEQYANALAHKVRKTGLSSAIKSNELMHTMQTGFGDEWVPELWSAQIWEKARQDNVVLPLFRAVEMPSSPFDLPVEGTDPSVYFVPETSNEAQLVLGGSGNPIPDSKIGSRKVQLDAKKLALRVGFSAELVEDAILPVLNIYRVQAMRAIADSIDFVLLNGDVEDTEGGNINTPLVPSGNERFMAFNGLRRLPLVTSTTLQLDVAGELTLAKLRETRFKMPPRYAARPGDLAWIVDSGTYAQLLNLSEFLTMDKAGALATAQTGQIGFIDGIPVFTSAEMPMTDDTGVVAASGNDKGTALCVYRPGWFVGYRRRIAVNVDYLPYYDSYQLTATVRLAFAPFDDSVASAAINITI
jgi:HK97 family phage major capsid protein